jgi:hypothetical protein
MPKPPAAPAKATTESEVKTLLSRCGVPPAQRIGNLFVSEKAWRREHNLEKCEAWLAELRSCIGPLLDTKPGSCIDDHSDTPMTRVQVRVAVPANAKH